MRIKLTKPRPPQPDFESLSDPKIRARLSQEYSDIRDGTKRINGEVTIFIRKLFQETQETTPETTQTQETTPEMTPETTQTQETTPETTPETTQTQETTPETTPETGTTPETTPETSDKPIAKTIGTQKSQKSQSKSRPRKRRKSPVKVKNHEPTLEELDGTA